MKTSRVVILIGLMICTNAFSAQSSLVNGVFLGTVYDTWGNVNGFDLTKLEGATITGSFSYDPNALLSSYVTDDPAYMNAKYQYNATIPVIITETISYMSTSVTYSFKGDSFSEVYAGKDYTPSFYDNWLYIQASQLNSSGAFISFRNSYGLNYLSNVHNLGSIKFSDNSPDSYGVSTFGVSNYQSNTGGYSFKIISSNGVGKNKDVHPKPHK